MKCKILVTAVMMNNRTMVMSLETSNRKITQKYLNKFCQKITDGVLWQCVQYTRVLLQLTHKGRVFYEISDVVYKIEELMTCITNYVMISDYEFYMRTGD